MRTLHLVFVLAVSFAANPVCAAELPGKLILATVALVLLLILLMAYIIFYGYLSLSRNQFRTKSKIVIFNIINLLFLGFYIVLITEFRQDISIPGFLFAIIPCMLQLNLSYRTTRLLRSNGRYKAAAESDTV